MTLKEFTVLILVAGLFGVACGGQTSAPTAAPPTQAPSLEETIQAGEATLQQATAEAELATEEAARAETEAASTEIALTEEAEARRATSQAATAEAVAEATASAAQLQGRVQDLLAGGHITKTDGFYLPLPDFNESWAQINWYRWWAIGIDPTDFVLRADASWESASDKANWWNSGCGIVYRIQEDGDHYMAFLGLDGNVYFYRNLNGSLKMLGRVYYGLVDTPAGEAELMLTVDGSMFTFFVNGERVHTRHDTAISRGDLAYTLVSGTNMDFGTRCELRNVELWLLE